MPATTEQPTSPTYPRAELEEMVERWLEANRRAEETGDWVTHLAPCYAEDAEYRWTVGPGEEFVALGKKQIEEWAIGVQMDGFQGWTYPYESVLIDEKQGAVVGFWRQVSPFRRADGSTIEVSGIGGSWFRYGGNQTWSWQRDFFDLMSVFSALSEINAQGDLHPVIKKKIQTMAQGKALAGHERVRPPLTIADRLKQGAALARVALLGR
ncbi:MAG: nuclear transport factor 2 family protein [Myxococcota bacterium]